MERKSSPGKLYFSLFLYIGCFLWAALPSMAQVPSVEWSYDLSAPSFGSAAAADLDKDGRLEIVFTTYTNDGKAYCLNAEDGSVNWIYNIGGCGDVAPLIYDTDGDDTLDVVINGSCNPTLFCINGCSGKLKWSVPSGGGDSPPTIGDVDGDSLPEILFGNFNGEVRILNAEDGSTANVIQADPTGNTIQTEPVLADVNGDGRLDFIVANYFNVDGYYIWAFDAITGDTLWTNYMFDTTSTFNAYHGGALADVDKDGKLEYVIGANNGAIRAINVEDGSQQWIQYVPSSAIGALSIADLDRDDTLDIVYTNNDPITFDERIGMLNGCNGRQEWSYSVPLSSFRGCAISDINGNGKLDLVSGHYMGKLYAVEPYSGLIWQYDLKQFFLQNFPWFDVDHGPLVADFDGDDSLEVFVVAGYGTYTPDSLNTGKAFMIKAGKGHCPDWLMFRHDIHRTAYLSDDDIAADCHISPTGIAMEKPTENELNFLITPNPFADFVSINIDGNFHDPISVQIFDLEGRLVRHLFSGIRNVETATITWDGRNDSQQTVSAGVYFCKIVMGGVVKCKRVVTMR